MKKFRSPINNREYWVDETQTIPFEGLPCFSFQEIRIMKGQKLSPHDLNTIFDTKLGIGATIESFTSPHKEIGYGIPPKDRAELAQDYAHRIKEMLKGMGAKTDEEKKIKP